MVYNLPSLTKTELHHLLTRPYRCNFRHMENNTIPSIPAHIGNLTSLTELWVNVHFRATPPWRVVPVLSVTKNPSAVFLRTVHHDFRDIKSWEQHSKQNSSLHKWTLPMGPQSPQVVTQQHNYGNSRGNRELGRFDNFVSFTNIRFEIPPYRAADKWYIIYQA